MFRDSDPISNQEARQIGRVLLSLKEKNHAELVSALCILKMDEWLLAHLDDPSVVFDILGEILIDLSFKNLRSIKNINSPGDQATNFEGQSRQKGFDFEEQGAHPLTKPFEQKNDEILKAPQPTFLSKSQKSISLISSITNSKNVSILTESEKFKEKTDFRINLCNKLVENLFHTNCEQEIENLRDLVKNIIVKSKTGSNLRIILEEVIYTIKFQELLFSVLFRIKNHQKFEIMAPLLICMIDHHEDFFFQRNSPDHPIKLSPPFFRFINDCVEPLNDMLTTV